MAIALVQKTTQQFYDGVTTASRTITGVTAGNLVTATVACQSVPNTSPVPALPTPSGWSVAIAPTGSTGIDPYRGIVGIFYKENAASGSHTIDFSGAAALPSDSYCEITIEEWSGAATASALDVVASSQLATPQTSGTSGTTATTSQANGLAIAVCCPGGGTVSALSSPPSSGYTAIDTSADNNTHCDYDAGYKILSSAGTQSASWTWTGDNSWVGAIATFKAAASVVDPLPGNIVDLPPLGRDYDYDLKGYQQSIVPADNSTATVLEVEDNLTPDGRNYDYELSGFQAASINSENNLAATLGVFDLPPDGRDFNYELPAHQYSPYNNPDALSAVWVPPFYDTPPLGKDFEYELAGYQQQGLPPDAINDNAISLQFVLPNFLGNFAPTESFLSGGVGPDAPLLPSDPEQWYENAPVLLVLHAETFEFPAVGPDAAPQLDSNCSSYSDNPPWIRQSLPNVEGFQFGAVGEDAAFIPDSLPSQHSDLPVTFLSSPAIFSLNLAGVADEGPLTAEVVVTHSALPPDGKNFEYELDGFHSSPLPGDNELATSPYVHELTPPDRDYNYELAGFQASPLQLDSVQSFASTTFDLTPPGRDFEYELPGFQLEPLATDIPLMASAESPLYFFPKIDADDILPYLGFQNTPKPIDVIPSIDSGPSFFIPNFRPRRR